MLIQRYVTQPSGGIDYLSLFRSALEAAQFQQLDVAVAYATVSGVRSLLPVFENLAGANWDGIEKRWVVGIDWCRSDPVALDQLSALAGSSVRIWDGEALV